MTKYAVLLRGINVSGHNIVKMQDLRKVLERLGLENVKTYIQSGNVVFQSDHEREWLKYQIEDDIKKSFGFSASAMLRTAAEWELIIRHCPFPVNALSEGESVHLVLLETETTKEDEALLNRYQSESENYYLMDKEIYLYFRKSFRDAKLAGKINKLGVPATVRNWKTVIKIQEMLYTL